jgi:hypothetical protein
MTSDNLTPLGYPWDYGERRGRDDKPSEFGWGRGLVPRGRKHAASDDRGMYAGQSARHGPVKAQYPLRRAGTASTGVTDSGDGGWLV